MSKSGGSILFCTPMYGGMCFKPYFESSLRLAYALQEMGIEHEFLTGRNESLVHRARMEMTFSFLNSHYTHMMWIDADMEFKVDDVARVWNLVNEPECDIAVAAYTMKRDDLPLSAWKDGKLITWDEFPDEPFEVDLAGTGFLLIPRYVVEKCINHLKEKENQLREVVGKARGDWEVPEAWVDEMLDAMSAFYTGPYGQVPAVYKSQIYQAGLESEDYSWCRLARECGFTIMTDPMAKPGHWGQARYGGHGPA